MAGFNDLPIELLDNVCKYLRSLCGNPEAFLHDSSARKALASLCLTSKKCLRAAQPQLYHGIASDSRNARIDVLATTFIQNKHLAPLVHELYLTSDYDVKHTEWLFNHMDVESRPPPSTRDSPVNEDTVPYEVRVLDLLFAQLSNANFIEISSAVGEDTGGLHFIRQQRADDSCFLPMLKELSIRHHDTEGGFTLDFALPLLSVTDIQRLSLWMCVGVGMQDLRTWTFPSLRELRIGYSGLDTNDFRHLVRLCPNLELLSFEMADDIVTQYCDDIATAHDISLALQPLNKTLRTLILTQYGERCDEDEGASIASLAGFSKLEHLVISLHQLTDDEGNSDLDEDEDENDETEENDDQQLQSFLKKLPRSLKSLYIQLPSGEDSVSRELCRLAACAERDFPNMKLLTVDAKLDIKARFKNTGIRYRELIRYPPINDNAELEKIAMAC